MSDFEQLPKIDMESDAIWSVDARLCEIVYSYAQSLRNQERADFKRAASFNQKVDVACYATAGDTDRRDSSYELKSLQVVSMLSRTALLASHNEGRDYMMPTGGDWDYWREVDKRAYGWLRAIVAEESGVQLEDYQAVVDRPQLTICLFNDHVIERTTNKAALLTTYSARPTSL